MSQLSQSLVMDVFPWPQGVGFTGSSAWWEYVLNKEERQKLDNLLGLALLSPDVCDRLVNQRDEALLQKFELSEEMQVWLCKVKADSLTELAQAILSAS